MTQKTWLLSLLLLMLSFQPAFALADTTAADNAARQRARENVQEMIDENKLSRVENREQVQEKRSETIQARCERVTAKINNRLNLYQENKDKYYHRYQGYRQQVEAKMDVLKNRGCDTSQIEADLPIFDQKLSDFAASFREFHNTLQGSRAYVCGESQGKFAENVSQSRLEFQVMRQQALALQQFVQNTFKVHARQTFAACSPSVTPTSK